MGKLNSLEMRAKDIDQSFADAIRRIATGDAEYSCCAISRLGGDHWKVRDLYVQVLEARPQKGLRLNLLNRVLNHVGCINNDESQGFRILMLSLVKAAWRDFV